jgi:deoxyribodipyrimidine photo-lyase
MEPVHVVLFKRDLRVHDHRPLREAARCGPVLPLYVVEPELWAQSDASARQWAFCSEALADLQADLARLGAPLVLRVGEVIGVLSHLQSHLPLAALWSHEETGNGWTYARDRALARWCRGQGIPWHQFPQNGVVRALGSRDGWARRWEERMGQRPLNPPAALTGVAAADLPPLPAGGLPTAEALALPADPCPLRQQGGRQAGLELLESFLAERGQGYVKGLSSPITAGVCCSRLSPHLAFGTLSLREIVHASRRRRGPRAFEERLHWHCHFMQKLESEPELEFREAHPAYAGLRCTDPERLAAWSEGRTGLPFVDACQRALNAEGWINFRMRALLMAVASYHLWIHWRDSGLVLARRFVDYEPGIHWMQCQMQAGTTGINTVRLYNPVKQGLDHDPTGIYVRRWVPELAGVPLAHLHTPWTLTAAEQEVAGCVLGVHYPAPIVDHQQAAREARDRVWAVRRGAGFRERADAIQERHGSRRSGLATPRAGVSRRRRQGASPGQFSLFGDP